MGDPIPLSRLQEPVSARFLTEFSRSPSPRDVNDIFNPSISSGNAADALAAIQPEWKRDLYSLLEEPTSSASAFAIHIFLTGLIILSAVVTVIETVPALHNVSPHLWFGLETSLVALFTVEYAARLLAWSGTWMSLFKWITCAQGINFCYTAVLNDLTSGNSILWNNRFARHSALLYRNHFTRGHGTFGSCLHAPSTSDYSI